MNRFVSTLADFEFPGPMNTVSKFSADRIHDKLSEHYPKRVLNWVTDAKWSSPEEVPLKEIDLARRPGGRNMKKVRSMARDIKDGKRMDPVFLVLPDSKSAPGGSGPYKIADGYHRALAHQHAGKQTIRAHIGYVEDDGGPWDRAMHDAKLNKVGPKGYIHGWIYVGPQQVGGRVFHHEHGHGEVISHEIEPGKKVRGGVRVRYDSGHEESYRARFKETNKPRMYGPADVTRTKPPEPKPKVKPKTGPTRLTSGDLTLHGMQVKDPSGERVGLVIPHPDGYFEIQHDHRGAHGKFKTEQEALDAMRQMLDLKKVSEQQHEQARQAELDFHRRQRQKSVHVGLGANLNDAQRARTIARREHIIAIHGDNLKMHDDLNDPKMRTHIRQFFALPEEHHKLVASQNYRIDMGLGTVADYRPELRGVRPAGYAEGLTWADSAGAQSSGANRWLVFGNTVKHGSVNIVAHEMGHAVDASINSARGDERFSGVSVRDHVAPWGDPGFAVYFNGLVDYDARVDEIRRAEYQDKIDAWRAARPHGMRMKEYMEGQGGKTHPGPPPSKAVRITPYYRDVAHGGHVNGDKEMFAESYAAYFTKADRQTKIELISRTLKHGIDDGDYHLGRVLVDYFDDMNQWIKENVK